MHASFSLREGKVVGLRRAMGLICSNDAVAQPIREAWLSAEQKLPSSDAVDIHDFAREFTVAKALNVIFGQFALSIATVIEMKILRTDFRRSEGNGWWCHASALNLWPDSTTLGSREKESRLAWYAQRTALRIHGWRNVSIVVDSSRVGRRHRTISCVVLPDNFAAWLPVQDQCGNESRRFTKSLLAVY